MTAEVLTPETSNTAGRERRRTERSIQLALIVTLLVGFTLRVWNINFDEGVGSHPDERSTSCFYAPTIGLPTSWEQFKDPTQSPLNPLWSVERQERRGFTYGHFPLYLGVGMAHLFPKIAPVAERFGASDEAMRILSNGNAICEGFAVAGRLVIALLDTLTILLIYLVGVRLGATWDAKAGRRRGSPALGLMAAAFYAFTAQAIQLSHFFAMDPASTIFTVLAVLGGIMMVQDRTIGAAVVTGVGIGLAVASKFSALPIIVIPIVALLLVLRQGSQRNQDDGASAELGDATHGNAHGPNGHRPNAHSVDARGQVRVIYGALLALILAGVTFFITSPYAILDSKNFVQATLVEQGAMVRGVADMPFTRQYRNTTPYIYFLEQQLRWGMWWPLGVVALAGSAWMLVQLGISMVRYFLGNAWGKLDDAQHANILLWAWVLPYFGLTGAFMAKFNRYMSPVLPFMMLFGAALIWQLWGRRSSSDSTSTEGTTQPPLTLDDPDFLEEPEPIAAVEPQIQEDGRWIHLRRGVATLLAVFALGGGMFWSAAYVNGVYNSEHPWITASRWVYENVPNGSLILWELWDDPIPKTIPGEPGMDMGSTGLRHIDWSPYEEDTPEKYEVLKAKLREADYVAYSSKRIYDSVDELPERYPMTTLYYDGMWSGDLGYEVAFDISTPPSLLGREFEDRYQADESWSLYDHPQVTIFRKVRDLTDAEFDAYFDRAWEDAIPWYRGEDSPLSPLLEAVGLGSSQSSADAGLINKLIAFATGEENGPTPLPPPEERPSLMLDEPLTELPVVDNYRWNETASESTPLAILWWWAVISLLGWLAWPICFAIFRPLRDRGYFFSRGFGWLLSGWFLWVLASFELAINSVFNAWITVLLLGIIGVAFVIRQRRTMGQFIAQNWGLLVFGEILFALAFLGFVYFRLLNPDIWQPWFGGEKFMEFAFLNGILRSPYFPPVDPHFAGGFINYYYFGIYLVAYLIKLTGIYAEVAFNLAIPMLFALTVIHAFGVVYSAVRGWRSEPVVSESVVGESVVDGQVVGESVVGEPVSGEPLVDEALADEQLSEEGRSDEVVPSPSHPLVPALPWRHGIGMALLAPLFVTLIGNLDGLGQVIRSLANIGSSDFRSAIPGLQYTVRSFDGLSRVLGQEAQLPPYNFWDPSRVIPATINEFPYWSFLFADLHPHLIGIPLSVLFLGLLLTLVYEYRTDWGANWRRGILLILVFGLLLGALASVNLWELPTYAGLGILGFIVCQYMAKGRVDWLLTVPIAFAYTALAYLLFYPFFENFTNVGAGGIGMVREPDKLGQWLLIWGFLGFVLLSWVVWAVGQKARSADDARASGLERMLSLTFRYFGRLPRLLYLHKLLVRRPTLGYLISIYLWPLGIVLSLILLWWGRSVLALCIFFLMPAFLLLWRRGRNADAGSLFTAILAATGLAILAGTQVIFLKDFLQGGDWYRMNTLFKFFSQVWVIWGVAAAIALPRLVRGLIGHDAETPVNKPQVYDEDPDFDETARAVTPQPEPALGRAILRIAWSAAFTVLLVSSLAYIAWGTPARLQQRFSGWQPEFGTLNGMAFMEQGVYTWPDASNPIELHYDWEAIQWLLENIHGNAVIVESNVVGYYREGGSRVASLTGLSGLRGMHASEQRYGDENGRRDGEHREFWETPDPTRTLALIDELDISFIYVGQLEMHSHPDGVRKLEQMAAARQLMPVFQNEKVTIYGVPDNLVDADLGQ